MNLDNKNEFNSPTEFFDHCFDQHERITFYANDPTGERENFYLCFEAKNLNNANTFRMLQSVVSNGFELYLDISDFLEPEGSLPLKE